MKTKAMLVSLTMSAAMGLGPAMAADAAKDRQVLFGETHLHTALSFDSYIFGNRNSPDDAYRYTKGEAITHPAGFEMKLSEPLDFQAVTDHAIYLGMLPALRDPRSYGLQRVQMIKCWIDETGTSVVKMSGHFYKQMYNATC